MTDPGPAGVTAATVARAIVALLVFAVLLAWGRSVVESRRYHAWGVAAVEADDWESAVLHFRHALQWHAPVGGRGAQSFDALVAVGDRRRERGDIEGALVAYRSARFGVMAVRHLWTPLADRLPALHEAIGTLMAAQVAGAGAPDPAVAARFTAQLDAYEDRRPNPYLGLGASIAFVAWLAALSMLAARGFTVSGGIARASFLRWGGASLVALATWLLCVRFA